jgi:heme oxygenase (biliverdin-producing, ferredoxin)
MSNLKHLTYQSHREAERQYFVKILLSGKISKLMYSYYLENQLEMYRALEKACDEHECLSKLIDKLSRVDSIERDIMSLCQSTKHIPYLKTTQDYIKHIDSISNDTMLLMAHIYVRYMGDLSGGQFIAKKSPGENNLYKFDYPIDDLKSLIRERLSDDMDLEASICFDFATRTFIEIVEKWHELHLDFFEKG